MYQANIAVIKHRMTRLKKANFIQEVNTITELARTLEPGSRQRTKLIRLLRWAYAYHDQHHLPPSR